MIFWNTTRSNRGLLEAKFPIIDQTAAESNKIII